MSVNMANKIAGALFGALFVCSTPSLASDDLPLPTGDVLLTISGELNVVNAEDTVVLDRAMLEEMGSTSFVTSTIWTEGDTKFTGVSLATLLERLGVETGTLKATAINDYAVEIPVADSLDEPGIVAYEMNDESMSIREKGPLWIVYPYDSDTKFQSEIYYSRSIWQLDRIVILP